MLTEWKTEHNEVSFSIHQLLYTGSFSFNLKMYRTTRELTNGDYVFQGVDKISCAAAQYDEALLLYLPLIV